LSCRNARCRWCVSWAGRSVRDGVRSSGMVKHLGLHPETVWQWVRDDDKGKRPSGERVAGSGADKDAQIVELQQVRELERGERDSEGGVRFFAQEMNPRPPLW